MDEQEVHPRLGLLVPPDQNLEDGQVGHGGHEEHGAVADDRDHVGRVEPHVGWQPCKNNADRP